MAGDTTVDQEDLSYRYDLEHAVGLMVSVPYHGVSPDGGIVWGVPNSWLGVDEDFVQLFKTSMESIFQQSVDENLGSNHLPERKAFSHEYYQPPAAQGWPEIAVWLWDNALPVLGALDVLISTGRTLRDAKEKIESWLNSKRWEISSELPNDARSERVDRAFTPSITLTPVGVAAIVCEDAAKRLGMTQITRVSITTRSPVAVGGMRHPSASNSYLVTVHEAQRTIAYVTTSSGTVVEHFIVHGGPITPLSIPARLGNSYAEKEVDGTIVLEFDE